MGTVRTINVVVLAPDLQNIAKVEDGSGLTRFKDMDKRWLLIQQPCFFNSDSENEEENLL